MRVPKILAAGYSSDDKVFFSLIQDGDQSFVHVNLAQGYRVYKSASEEECQHVNNLVADFYEQGKKQIVSSSDPQGEMR